MGGRWKVEADIAGILHQRSIHNPKYIIHNDYGLPNELEDVKSLAGLFENDHHSNSSETITSGFTKMRLSDQDNVSKQYKNTCWILEGRFLQSAKLR